MYLVAQITSLPWIFSASYVTSSCVCWSHQRNSYMIAIPYDCLFETFVLACYENSIDVYLQKTVLLYINTSSYVCTISLILHSSLLQFNFGANLTPQSYHNTTNLQRFSTYKPLYKILVIQVLVISQSQSS